MTKTLTIIALMLSTIVSATSIATEFKYYTDNQYPYNRLIARADTIKIIYSEKQENVQCRVSIEWKELHQESTQMLVDKKQFEEAPLTNCLPRALAKSILSKTFD